MSNKFVDKNIQRTNTRKPIRLRTATGGKSWITEFVTVNITIKDVTHSLRLLICDIDDNVLLGWDWLVIADPDINFVKRTINFKNWGGEERLRKFAISQQKEENPNLPPRRPGFDAEIRTENRPLPKPERHRAICQEDLVNQRDWLTEALEKGWISPSKSCTSAPTLFVPKKGGKRRMCIDYRKLNAVTTPDIYPIPSIKETNAMITGHKYYAKLDLSNAYHLLRIKEGDEYKTAFSTRWGIFEYNVLPFGLTNAPSQFQRWINHVIREYMDVWCTAYLDDTIIWADSEEELKERVQIILGIFKDNHMQVNMDKSTLCAREVEHLGFLISEEGIKMDPERTKTIQEWERPCCTKDIRSFVGFCNFCRDFIPSFSETMQPLTSATRKGIEFTWDQEKEKSFQEMKNKFLTHQLLAAYKQGRPTEIESDASDRAYAFAIRQQQENGTWKAVAYGSGKFTDAERNWPTHDRELYGILRAMTKFEYITRGNGRIIVWSDNQALTKFRTTMKLKSRQVRWSQILEEYDFEIRHRPGKHMQVDHMTRRCQDGIAGDGNEDRILLPDRNWPCSPAGH